MSRLEPDFAADTARLEAPRSRAHSVLTSTGGRRRRWWRHVLGLVFLSITIFLWTTSNFLSSTIFADDTYSKPFLVTFLNTAVFIFTLVPPLLHSSFRGLGKWKRWTHSLRQCLGLGSRYTALKRTDDRDEQASDRESVSEEDDIPDEESYYAALSASQELLLGDAARSSHDASSGPISVRATAQLSLQFCLLWFIANYAVGASLQYTTVASGTILTSTSSVFTLIFGVLFRVEKFTARKLLSILTSLAGIVLISTIDFSGSNSDDKHRGDFPSKTPGELAIGNSLALLSAVMYGVYAIFLKFRVPNEEHVNMPLFFGFVGLANVLLLWPGFIILHFTDVEPFELPPSPRVTTIILMNALVSLISDVTWAYAVVLTSPVVVTVGLSLIIPVTLIGQVILNHQTVGLWYCVGAVIVVLSFVFVQQDENVEIEDQASADTLDDDHDD